MIMNFIPPGFPRSEAPAELLQDRTQRAQLPDVKTMHTVVTPIPRFTRPAVNAFRRKRFPSPPLSGAKLVPL